jgi:hypothetical protein
MGLTPVPSAIRLRSRRFIVSLIIRCDRITSPIVELRRNAGFRAPPSLGVLRRAAGFEVSSDARCTKRMTTRY